MGISRTPQQVDNTTSPLGLNFVMEVGAPATTADPTVLNAMSVDFEPGHGILVGEFLGFLSGTGRFYFGTALTVVSNTVTFDTPFDFVFPAATSVLRLTKDMNVDGSSTTKIFQVGPVGPDLEININRFMLQMTLVDPPLFSDFGDITGGLTNGIVLRRNNGVQNNIFNVKRNSELSLISYDYEPYFQTNPSQDINGIGVRYTFNGADKHDTVIRLGEGESLDLWIQDDLSTLTEFNVMAQGREV